MSIKPHPGKLTAGPLTPFPQRMAPLRVYWTADQAAAIHWACKNARGLSLQRMGDIALGAMMAEARRVAIAAGQRGETIPPTIAKIIAGETNH